MGRRKRKRLTAAQKWVVWFAFLPLALGVGNMARMGGALRGAADLPGLPLSAPWAYLAVMGGLWAVVFVGCVVGLVRFRRWGQRLTLASATLYELHVWVNHLLFDANDYARLVWPRDLALSLLLLALVWGFLSWPGIRKAFGSASPR